MIRGFLLVCFLAEMGQTSPCSENQHRLMQGEFSECRNNYYNSYNSGESESGVCTLLDEIMTLCTNIWKQCHTEHEINRMKTDHLELLISHMGLTTQNCQIVRESKTASTTTEGSELGCSDEETTRASEHFHSCSAVISEQVHASVVDAVEPVNAVDASSNNIHHILCQGLHKISAQCPRLLKPCFKPSDIVHMRSSLMDNMRTFFKRLAMGKLPPGTTLENCKHRNKQANPRLKKQEAKNEIKHLVEEQQHNEPQLPQEPLQQQLPSPPQPQPPTPPPQQQPQPPPQQQQLPHPPPPQQQQPPHQQQLPQQPPKHQQPQHPPRQQLPQQPPRQPQPKTNDSPQPKSSDLTSSAPNGRLQILFLSLNIFMSLFCL